MLYDTVGLRRIVASVTAMVVCVLCAPQKDTADNNRVGYCRGPPHTSDTHLRVECRPPSTPSMVAATTDDTTAIENNFENAATPTATSDQNATNCDRDNLTGTIATIFCVAGYETTSHNGHNQYRATCSDDGEWILTGSSTSTSGIQCQPVCGVLRTEAGSDGPVRVPWHVTIYRTHLTVYYPACGGTIVNANTIVTNAGCIINIRSDRVDVDDKSKYLVGTGKLYSDFNAEEPIQPHFYALTKIVTPEYTSYADVKNMDIALLILNRTIAFDEIVQPVCLRKISTEHGDNETEHRGNVENIGHTLHTGLIPIWLNASSKVEKPSINLTNLTTIAKSSARCQAKINGSPSNGAFCTTVVPGHGICGVDQGSGFVVAHQNVDTTKRYHLHGVMNGLQEYFHSDCSDAQVFLFDNLQYFTQLLATDTNS